MSIDSNLPARASVSTHADMLCFSNTEALLCCLDPPCIVSSESWPNSTRAGLSGARMSNVTVCVRFRPLSHKERKANADNVCFRKLDSESFVFKVWCLFSLLPLASLLDINTYCESSCAVPFGIYCYAIVLYIGSQDYNLPNTSTFIMTIPFWPLTCLSITLHNYAMGAQINN
jgi:hypothetical protein